MTAADVSRCLSLASSCRHATASSQPDKLQPAKAPAAIARAANWRRIDDQLIWITADAPCL